MMSRSSFACATRVRRLAAWGALGAGLLAGCSGGTSSGISDSAPGTKRVSSATIVQQVRAAGQVGNELDVQPLRDPQVEDLRNTATQAEERGDHAAAQRALSQALQLTPDDPELLQWQAELALATRQWAQAESWATRSYEKGPKLGGLCRRNWMTIHYAAEARGNTAAATQAQQRVAACTVPPPTRM
jgi:Flp pilus assembly protein TadD